ncbi:MAG: insulinase family protein [Clostridia bacterium]|nr:insulinase family protein [Clostridia bacterium]
MKPQKNMHGFEFISSREVPELSGTLHEAVYTKNGAKLLFIDREDSNKTFAIAFKTIPTDDTGVFHIIEHSVLCGSEKYPVKEPFVELLKGSLKTFLNAFTFPDKTMYPVSSRNEKDFLNLVDIYMDAVLHPLAIKKKEIFYQEGWHYELHKKSDDIIYKGVVFNEMKGAYSSADEVEMEEMSALLYKDSCYGRDSGGNPTAIPTLTYEDFVASHAKYYHPSNSRIILDGSVDLDKTLALLDSFLSEYDYLEVDSDIPMVEPMGYAEKTIAYEISEGEDPEGKARVCLGFAASDFSDRKTISALTILSDAIAGTNEAPFKKAMLDSGLCEDVNFISYDGIQQNSILIEIKNVKEQNIDKVKTLCFDTLRAIADSGINKDALLASHNSLEFRMREQDMATFPAGIAYAISALDTWLYGGDPMSSLSFESDIAFLRDALSGDYYEKLLRRIFLESKHSAALYMLPSAKLGEQRIALEKSRLALAKANMDDEDLDKLIALNDELEAWQKSSDSAEALATIPSLGVEDINKLPEKYPSTIYELEGVPAVYTESSSRGITYTSLLFDVSDFDKDELCVASLVIEILKNVETENYDAVSLQNKIKTELGTLGFGSIVATKDGKTTPYIQIGISCLDSKRASAVELCREVALGSKFTDKSVIEIIVKQLKTQSAEAIAASGHSVAFARAASYVSREAAVSEYIDGLENYLWIKELDKNFAARADEFCEKLATVSSKIFTRARLTACHSGSRADEYMKNMIDMLPEGVDFERGSKIEPLGVRREGLLIPASIAFASKAANVFSVADTLHGSLGAVRSILSFGYLWNAIRVQGGAYGAGFIKRNNGTVGYYTYRDPDAKRSLGVFDESTSFLRSLAESGDDITNFIIGAVGDSDPLITPKVLSALSVASYLRGETYESRAKAREELISTGKDELLAMADILDSAFANAGVCVVGGKDKLEACGEILNSIIEI